MEYSRLRSTLITVALIMSLGLVYYSASKPPQTAVELSGETFRWLDNDANEEAVSFEWSVEIINGSGREFDVRVILSFRDGDDREIATDAVSINLQPQQTQSVAQRGSIPFNLALDVVSWNLRYDPAPPEGL